MFGLILLYSTLCAADTTTKKRLATTNYVDCKLSDKVNTSSILHAPRDDYDVNDVLSADAVVKMFDKYYDKDDIDKQDFIEYITADDKKCFSKYSDDIWILDNPPNIDSYVVNIRIISELDDGGVEINASIVVENGNTTSIRNIGHSGSNGIGNSWVFYPNNFTFYTTSEFRPAMSISACITSMYSGKYYNVEYIDNTIASLEDKIQTAAGGNYLSMDSVISEKKDKYNESDVLTYKVLKDTYASQQALTTLKDSIYSKVEIDNMFNGDYKEYITADNAKCFSMKDEYTWILNNPPTASSYTINITFKKDNIEVYDSITVVDGEVKWHLLTDIRDDDFDKFKFDPNDFTFYVDGESKYNNFRPSRSGSSACVTAMYTGTFKGALYNYYTKAEVDSIRDVLDNKIAEATNDKYIPTGNIETTLPDELKADDAHVLSTKASISAFASKSAVDQLGGDISDINGKLTTGGVDNYLKRAEVINITSAIDKKQLDTHIALSADSAALIALERAGESDQVVRRNDAYYSTLVNRSTVEDIVSRSKLYYRKDNFNFISSENICFEKDANNGFHKVHSIMLRPENTSYTIIADLYLDDARVLPCVIDVVNHSLVKSSVDGVVACAVTDPDCVGEELADNLWFRITPDSSHYSLTAKVCIRSIIDKGDLNQYYTAEEVDAVAVLRGNIHETGDISQNYTPDDAHVLTAAATEALITNRAHAAHNTAEFTTRIDTSDKFVYLAVEACDDDYIYEGVLPIGVLSVNEKCSLNIANNDDMISFKVFNSDDGKDEVFDIRLVVY